MLKLPPWIQKFRLKAIGFRANKKLKLVLLTLAAAVLAAVLAFFSLRDAVLNRVLDNKIASYLGHRPGAVLHVGAARFSGIDRIVFKDIRLGSARKDIALSLASCAVRVSFWNMLVGRVRLEHLELQDMRLDLRQGGAPRADTARPAGGVPAPRVAGEAPDYAARAAAVLDLFFTRIPGTFKIDRLTVLTDFDGVQQTFHIPLLAIDGPAFATTVEINDLEKTRAYYFTGNIQRRKKQLALHLLPLRRGAAAALPFIDRQWGLRVSFDSITISLESHDRRQGVLRLAGSFAVGGLTVNHRRIAAEDVNLENAAIDYVLNIGADYFEMDRSTRVLFNKLEFRPYLKFEARPARRVLLKLEKTRFKADDLFSSLPAGLFTSLAGIKTSGKLAFHFNFAIDLDRPESVILDSDLEKGDLRILRFGRVDFRAVNGPFLYTAYEKDQAQRSFMVGPENPDFRGLDEIPSRLKNSVLISEDGAFFGHSGFLLGPFKDSIAANLRQGRFVRGASTISMQLVKNLYLKRQKTIARKLEEMLITWLIEENHLISKERMFEIYMNIIEWGPLVYGAAEAARFYFEKDVADLTLAEAIFMASIIPRPKRFMASFDENRRLRPWLTAYYTDVSEKMLLRGWISQLDYDELLPDIRLNGPAQLLLKGSESMGTDVPPPDDEPLE
jgi:hypothetical protein